MTVTKRDPRTLEKAPLDESWLRGAAIIDAAAADMLALDAAIKARRTNTHGDDAARLFSRAGAANRIAPGDAYPIAGGTPTAPGPGARTVGTDPVEAGMLPFDSFGPERTAS